MVLKLYGFPFSTCTKRVAVTLKEHNVPYELVVIDLPKGEQRDPAYMEIQPFGQTPAIVRVCKPSFSLDGLRHITAPFLWSLSPTFESSELTLICISIFTRMTMALYSTSLVPSAGTSPPNTLPRAHNHPSFLQLRSFRGLQSSSKV